MKITKAVPADVPAIKEIIDAYSADGKTVSRPLAYLYSNIRDYFVCKKGGKIVGCCSLHVAWGDLAEIKSLAVHPTHKSNGIGTALVKACLKEARELGIARTFALTTATGFFEKLGFEKVAKTSLPMKVFGECLQCSRYPDCDEEAMVKTV
ncbi:MAG: N-acetyltransferase [Candidatus Micrarchaeota archaeon]|nr:N-acetyltransferase [Candidatus Micrarchaeota archaeon]